MRPKQSAKTTLQDVGDELLVLDRETNRLHHLNPTASWIYRRCDGRTSVENLVDALTEQFAIEREPGERDLLQTLAQLRTLGLITADA
jgi:PqqD family protein of HPr-rel-A system